MMIEAPDHFLYDSYKFRRSFLLSQFGHEQTFNQK